MINHETRKQAIMGTPPVVSPEAWETARREMLVKENRPDPRPRRAGF